MNILTGETDDYGLPPIEVTAHPLAAQSTRFDVDNSVNKALPWVAFSMFLSGAAIIGLILMALLMPTLIDAKVASGVSAVKAEMAQQLAAANETANSGRMFGRLANEKSDRVLAQLEARGLVKQENH